MYSYNEKFEGKLPVNNNFVLPDQYSSWKKEPEVIKLRKRVLIIIGILLVNIQHESQSIDLDNFLFFLSFRVFRVLILSLV